MDDFWLRQSDKPLFPEIEWNKPEQKGQAGKLAIIGGNKSNFSSVSANFGGAESLGIGQARVVLPLAVKNIIKTGGSPNIFFAESNSSGSFSEDSLSALKASADWADVSLLLGDFGKNAETEVVIEKLIGSITKNGQKSVITRDAVDTFIGSAADFLDNPELILIASFAQLQKLLRAVFYPKILTFSLNLNNFVEILHKFTITYPCVIATLHQEHFVIAGGGKVITTPLSKTKYSPLSLWSGEIATRAAVFYAWNPGKPLEATATSII